VTAMLGLLCMLMIWYLLVSSSICELQKMMAVCANEATKINMQFNASKCAICRFGPRYLMPCVQICIQVAPVNYVQKVSWGYA